MAQFTDFIPQNTALSGVRRIGIYDSNGNRAGFIPLGPLTPPAIGKRLYSFGAIADIHVVFDTAAEDFQKALTFFNDAGVNFICICGDLGYMGTEDELQQYKAITDAYSNGIPIYVAAGNHEYYASTSNAYYEQYTGSPLYYTVEKDNDVFIMFGVVSGTQGNFFEEGSLQWLYEMLEVNRNKRCFLFQHILLDDGCGDIHNLYGNKLSSATTEGVVFKSLLSHYPNVIFFHGHSHVRFYLQEDGDTANYDKLYGCHSVHIPSLSVPRDVNDDNSAFEIYYGGSEGYVVDVYENGIHLRGRDFVKGQFLPIASYWLDTTLHTVEAGTYTDSTGTITP